eukprot:GFUD01030197.1.p1 GENE.GFUD01030197.1~~GFUD01030197.1.p1  ORF type:complete len:174 (+),score=39.57 GFUD01030197.1:37-522(+)
MTGYSENDEDGFEVQIDIEDGREPLDTPDGTAGVEFDYNTSVRVKPSPDKNRTFMIELGTTHYAFSCHKSCTTRTLDEFYQLQNILKNHHLYVSMPKLPLKIFLFISSKEYVSQELARFLFGVLTQKKLLSSKALHLFLQTNYSMDIIMLNCEGVRDDVIA